MESDSNDTNPAKIARKLPVTGARLTWSGKTFRLTQERNGVWRCRSRSKDYPVDVGLGTADLALAKELLRKHLETSPAVEITKGTLAQIAQVYLSAVPLRCKDLTAKNNVATLRSMVEFVHGKTLAQVKPSILPALWFDYVAKKQGRKSPDFSRRDPMNGGINASLAHAVSMFRRSFLVHYEKHGIVIPQNAAAVEYLPRVYMEPAAVDDARLVEFIESLESTNRMMWLIFGLARFAGLRRNEIMAARGKWFVRIGSAVYVELKDRYEDGYRTKTGKVYRALIMNQRLADYVMAISSEELVLTTNPPVFWMDRVAIEVIRPYTGASRKPLHRLRGLYADMCAGRQRKPSSPGRRQSKKRLARLGTLPFA